MEAEVAAGRFRADLYHRLNVYPIHIPPLRERGDDTILLAGYFAERSMARLGITRVRISNAAQQKLAHYNWPGNVRELENIISRSVLKATADTSDNEMIVIQLEHLAGDLDPFETTFSPRTTRIPTKSGRTISLREEVLSLQKRLIQNALEGNNGNWSAAARSLTMNRSNLHNLATRLGLRTKKSNYPFTSVIHFDILYSN